MYNNILKNTSSAKLPTPTKENIMNWVELAYETIREESIRKTFRHIGYVTNEKNFNAENDFDSTVIMEMQDKLHETVQIDEIHEAVLTQRDLILSPRIRSNKQKHFNNGSVWWINIDKILYTNNE